VQLAKPIFHA